MKTEYVLIITREDDAGYMTMEDEWFSSYSEADTAFDDAVTAFDNGDLDNEDGKATRIELQDDNMNTLQYWTADYEEDY